MKSFAALSAVAAFLSASYISAAPVAAAEAGLELAKQAPIHPYVIWDDALDNSTLSYGTPFDTHAPVPWVKLSNQGINYYNGTESYTTKNGQILLNLPGVGRVTNDNARYDVEMWSSKKSDRGLFNVYCGQTLIGEGNEYSSGSGETTSQVVYSAKGIKCDYGYLVFKNDRGAKFMALDMFVVSYYNAV